VFTISVSAPERSRTSRTWFCAVKHSVDMLQRKTMLTMLPLDFLHLFRYFFTVNNLIRKPGLLWNINEKDIEHFGEGFHD
jgi:hypothetical protein